MDRLDEIKKLYFQATPASVRRDLERAIDLLKEMASEDERERASVFMEGLAQMRSEWAQTRVAPPGPRGARRSKAR